MAENSKISWTDATFNPWIGCSKVSPGCVNCYAENLMDKRYGRVKWGLQGTRTVTAPANWRQPLKWNREAQASGERRRVFCASLADIFEDWHGPILNAQKVPLLLCDCCGAIHRNDSASDAESCKCGRLKQRMDWLTMNDLRLRLFRMIEATPWLDWLLLTKRPENIGRMWPTVGFPDAGQPGSLGRRLWLSNVWLGTTVENQEYAEKRLPDLFKCRDLSPVLFASYEPAIGPVDWEQLQAPGALDGLCYNALYGDDRRYYESPAHLDWIIVGGESDQGEKARLFDIQWARRTIYQCRNGGIPVFMKQVGSNPWLVPGELESRRKQPGYVPLRDRAGANPDEWPEDLRVREFPTVRATACD